MTSHPPTEIPGSAAEPLRFDWKPPTDGQSNIFEQHLNRKVQLFVQQTAGVFDESDVLARLVTYLEKMAAKDASFISEVYGPTLREHADELLACNDDYLVNQRVLLFRQMNLAALWPLLDPADADDVECRRIFWLYVRDLCALTRFTDAVGDKVAPLTSKAFELVNAMRAQGLLEGATTDPAKITAFVADRLLKGDLATSMADIINPNDTDTLHKLAKAFNLKVPFGGFGEGEGDADDGDADGAADPSTEEQLAILRAAIATQTGGDVATLLGGGDLSTLLGGGGGLVDLQAMMAKMLGGGAELGGATESAIDDSSNPALVDSLD
jgi:hypothetical protein